MNKSKIYDIIIAGAGLSGLSLAWYLIKEKYSGQILLIDKSFAPTNHKTWCFFLFQVQKAKQTYKHILNICKQIGFIGIM